MNQEWNPELRVFEIETGLIIQIDLAGLDGEGVTVTVDGCLLLVHRSPCDGPPDEIVLECPPEYDPSEARAEARSGVFHIELPRRKDLQQQEMAAKRLASFLSKELERTASQMNEIKEAPWGHFSQN